jgi:hypothetical protein
MTMKEMTGMAMQVGRQAIALSRWKCSIENSAVEKPPIIEVIAMPPKKRQDRDDRLDDRVAQEGLSRCGRRPDCIARHQRQRRGKGHLEARAQAPSDGDVTMISSAESATLRRLIDGRSNRRQSA